MTAIEMIENAIASLDAHPDVFDKTFAAVKKLSWPAIQKSRARKPATRKGKK